MERPQAEEEELAALEPPSSGAQTLHQMGQHQRARHRKRVCQKHRQEGKPQRPMNSFIVIVPSDGRSWYHLRAMGTES